MTLETRAQPLLGGALKDNTALKKLHLLKNRIGDTGAAAIGAALKVNNALTVLDLMSNNIGIVGATTIADALMENDVLQELRLFGNSIGDAGAVAFAEVLKVNSALTQLHLEWNNIGDAGAAAIAGTLTDNAVLTHLDLSWNTIGEKGATALAEALKFNSALTELRMTANNIGDAGAVAFAEALKFNSALTSLFLPNNTIGDNGAIAIAGALKINSALIHLSLAENNIENSNITATIDAYLERNKAMVKPTATATNNDVESKKSSTTVVVVLVLFAVISIASGLVYYYCPCHRNGEAPQPVPEDLGATVHHASVTNGGLAPVSLAGTHTNPVFEAAGADALTTTLPPPAWDQRNQPREVWSALLDGKPSGTFIIRKSRSGSTDGVVGTITVVKPGGDGFFNKQIRWAPKDHWNSSSGFRLDGSVHTHTSLPALITFYQNSLYFAQASKPDVPTELVVPNNNALYDAQDLSWRNENVPSEHNGIGAVHHQFHYDGTGSGAGAVADGHGSNAGTSEVNDDIDGIYVKCTPYNPLDQLASTETVKLITAAAKTAPYCKDDPVAVYREAMQVTRNHPHIGTVQRVGAPALTHEDIATMYMYTMDSDFYKALNRELSLSYGDEDATHNCAEHFLPYTKLMVAALGKLPLVQAKLWRGIPDKSCKECMGKNQAGDDVKVDDVVTWTSFTSCSTSPKELQSENFLGDVSGGQAVARTVFQIFAVSGVSINAYSAFPTEGEVIILPGSKFRVEKFTDGKKGVVEVRMRQIADQKKEKEGMQKQASVYLGFDIADATDDV